MGLHFILQHLDKSGTYVRILFVDFNSTFNTIIPTLLQTKLIQLSVSSSICQWITSFLTDRQQLVRLGKSTSNSRSTNTGGLQGCVLSPLLFSLYTNDCTSKDPSVKLLKFADDTTLIGLIQGGDESAYRQEVEQLAVWCSLNNLELNTLKTVEMIMDFRRNPPALPPLTIMDSTVTTVEPFRFLGTIISQDLNWDTHIDSIAKKAQQRLYFLRQLRKFNLPQELLKHFYSAVIESVLCISITVWFGSAKKIRNQKTIENGLDCWKDYWCSPAHPSRTVHIQSEEKGSENHSGSLTSKPSPFWTFAIWPVLQSRKYQGSQAQEQFLPPGNLPYEQLNVPPRAARHKNSFFPQAIYLMNS